MAPNTTQRVKPSTTSSIVQTIPSKSFTPTLFTASATKRPDPTPTKTNLLLPAPAWTSQERAFWQEVLDALNTGESRQIESYIDKVFLTFDVWVWGLTPAPPSQVAQYLAEATNGGTSACVGFSEDSILVSLPRPLQIPGVGNYGSYITLHRYHSLKIEDIKPYPPVYGSYSTARYWPCDLAGLVPVRKPDIYVLWETRPQEDFETAVVEFVRALEKQNFQSLQTRLLPRIAYAMYEGIRNLEPAEEIMLSVFTKYTGSNIKCIGYNSNGTLIVANFQLPPPNMPYLKIFFTVDNDGLYKAAVYYFIDSMEDIINDYNLEHLRPCPPPLQSSNDIPPEERPCWVAPRRLKVGQQAMVCTQKDPVILRKGPGKNFPKINSLAPGSRVSIIDGPKCDAISRMWYWHVQTPAGQQGWIAEGGDFFDPYYLCPNP